MINQKRSRICEILEGKLHGKSIECWGWIRSSRFSKNVSFITINDGSSQDSLQLVADNQLIDLQRSQLLTGSCIKVNGQVVESSGSQKYELQLEALEVFSAADEAYPLQKKRHSQEFLREICHLRPRTNTHLAIGTIRNKLAWAIHKFFHEKGFRYVHAPTLTTSDCEGAGEMFRVTAQNPAQLSADKKPFYWNKDLFGKETYLSVSGQLEGEALALAYGEIYTFAPIFRADPSDTTRHASEFWMIEPEMAFYDFEDLQALISEFVRSVAQTVWQECQNEIKFFSRFIEPELEKRYQSLMGESFKSLSFYEAQEILKNCGKKFEITPDPEKDLATEHERYLVDEHFKQAVFVTDYPSSFKAFYMRANEDKKTVACLDLLVPGIGEILTGSQREERFSRLEEKMTELGLDENYRWYLETRRWGSAPHSGFGIGFERFLMYLTGMKNIKDVQSFPRASGRIW